MTGSGGGGGDHRHRECSCMMSRHVQNGSGDDGSLHDHSGEEVSSSW